MAQESESNPKWDSDLTGIAIVIGAALLGSGVLFALLYVGLVYFWR